MTEEVFQEITITGCNRSKTAPTLTTDYHILASFHFTLSASPPEDWIHIFEQVREDKSRQAPAHLPPTRVDSHGIVIKCRPDDLQQSYDGLKEDVATANQKYREMLAKSVRNEERKRAITQAIDAALDTLKM
jgi:hypothetical protein